MLRLSVIICTHNPRLNNLERVFEELKQQTLGKEEYELLLVDNGSTQSLSEVIDLSWHPFGRHIYEKQLGLTPARVRGIIEASSELLLFVDDDNCLNSNYLEICLRKMNENPLIGVLGAGKIIPEFEVEPSEEVLPFVDKLALRNNERAFYSNDISFNSAIPFGAGLCIRKSIALKYVESCKKKSFASALDRTGNELLSGGDVDLALHACKEGYLSGVIPELELTHIIPKSRLEKDYLIKIAAGHAFSHYLLGKMWGYLQEYPENEILKKIRYFKQVNKAEGLRKAIFIEEYKAVNKARKVWLEAETN